MTLKTSIKKDKFSGYVIGRKLWENNPDGKTASQKNFTYYPEKEHGKPPYLFKTKAQALKSYNKLKKQNKFPADQSNAVVFKFSKKTYLDRY